MKTPEPGLHAGILFDEYVRWPGASQSRLKTAIDRTPRRAHYEMTNPSPSTQAQIVGAAIHVATLQPTLFDHLYPPRPEGNANSNAWKAAAAAIKAENPFAEILRDSDREMVLAVAKAVRTHPEASLLLGANAEQSAFWLDEDSGVWCKARIDDWLPGITLVDLKSATDASEEAFRKAIAEYGYHIQAALYQRCAKALNLDAPDYTFIVPEKDEPYDVAVYRLHEGSIQIGDEWLSEALPMWRKWEASGVWPSYRSNDISLPDWAMKQHSQFIQRVA